jgi:hypothetical protein
MSAQRICTINMLRAELQNAMLYGARGAKSLGWWGRNSCGTLSYKWH